MCLLMSLSVQGQTLTGVVTDENGQPLPGASILANGGAKGVSSNIDGQYQIELGAGNHQVLFSFVGYIKVTESIRLNAGQTKTVNVQLKTDAVLMDDVVVVGYGVQRKKEVTGSISQIDSKQITAVRTPRRGLMTLEDINVVFCLGGSGGSILLVLPGALGYVREFCLHGPHDGDT